jgi:hypothetical protein
MIALALEAAFADAGADVVGNANTVSRALALAETPV